MAAQTLACAGPTSLLRWHLPEGLPPPPPTGITLSLLMHGVGGEGPINLLRANFHGGSPFPWPCTATFYSPLITFSNKV